MEIRYLLKKAILNDSEKKYLEKKIYRLEKYFKKLDQATVRAEVEISVNTLKEWRAELMIKTPYNLYRAVKKGQSFLEAVDLMDGAIQQQIRRQSEKAKRKR